MKKNKKLWKVTRFHSEKGYNCVSETIIEAQSYKKALELALQENEIHVAQVEEKNQS